MNHKNHSSDNIPKLRFPEFSDAWEVKKLADIILKLSSGVSVNSTDEPIKEIGEYGILKTSCISSGKFYPTQNKKIVSNEILKAKLNPLADTILISRMNTPQLVGESGYIDSDYPNLFIPDRLWMTDIGIQNNAKFLSILLSSNNMMEKISNIATGTSGSMKNISKPNFLDIECTSPTLPEQQRIATFISTVNEKLQALKKKKSLLETYKKGLMQKLFSQEIRFKDDDGKDFEDWGVTKLGEIGIFFSGGTPLTTKRHYFDGNIPFIRSGEINSNKTEQFISEEGLKNSSAKMVEVGDLIYALYGATSGEVGISKIKGAINQAILCIRTEMDNRFLNNYFLLNKDNIINTYLQGGQGNLSAEIIKSLEVPVPSLPEQTKIANFLTAIDEKITNVDTQIKQTELWKKGLLQQMFV